MNCVLNQMLATSHTDLAYVCKKLIDGGSNHKYKVEMNKVNDASVQLETFTTQVNDTFR